MRLGTRLVANLLYFIPAKKAVLPDPDDPLYLIASVARELIRMVHELARGD